MMVTLLMERFGNPFVVQKVCRDKIVKWPKISPKDSLVLKDFADVLLNCAEAMPNIKRLAILNDCGKSQVLEKITLLDCSEMTRNPCIKIELTGRPSNL